MGFDGSMCLINPTFQDKNVHIVGLLFTNYGIKIPVPAFKNSFLDGLGGKHSLIEMRGASLDKQWAAPSKYMYICKASYFVFQ